jgi:hypothetical protein
MVEPSNGLCISHRVEPSNNGKPFLLHVKINVIGNGEVNCNGKQLTNGKRKNSVNGKKIKQCGNAHS